MKCSRGRRPLVLRTFVQRGVRVFVATFFALRA